MVHCQPGSGRQDVRAWSGYADLRLHSRSPAMCYEAGNPSHEMGPHPPASSQGNDDDRCTWPSRTPCIARAMQSGVTSTPDQCHARTPALLRPEQVGPRRDARATCTCSVPCLRACQTGSAALTRTPAGHRVRTSRRQPLVAPLPDQIQSIPRRWTRLVALRAPKKNPGTSAA